MACISGLRFVFFVLSALLSSRFLPAFSWLYYPSENRSFSEYVSRFLLYYDCDFVSRLTASVPFNALFLLWRFPLGPLCPSGL